MWGRDCKIEDSLEDNLGLEEEDREDSQAVGGYDTERGSIYCSTNQIHLLRRHPASSTIHIFNQRSSTVLLPPALGATGTIKETPPNIFIRLKYL